MDERYDPQTYVQIGGQPGWTPQQQAWGQPPSRQGKRRRTTPLWATIAAGVGGLVLGAGIGAGGKTDNSTPAAAAAPVVTTVTVTAPAPPLATSAAPAPTASAPPAAPATSSSKPAPRPTPAASSRPAAAPTTKAAPPAPKPTTKPTTKPASQVVLSTSGNGIKDTASFTTGPEWSVKYTFDCSAFGMQGNFIVDVDGAGNTVANALAASGADTTYQHQNPGTHYLSVNSECDWTLTVVNG